MTVIAQDPSVRVKGAILTARIAVPAEDLIPGRSATACRWSTTTPRPAAVRLLAAERRGKPETRRLHALLSTLPGKHGKTSNKTEVPRRPLLEALRKDTRLLNTDDLKFGATPELCHRLVVTP